MSMWRSRPLLAAPLFGTVVLLSACGSYRSHAAVVEAAQGAVQTTTADQGTTPLAAGDSPAPADTGSTDTGAAPAGAATTTAPGAVTGGQTAPGTVTSTGSTGGTGGTGGTAPAPGVKTTAGGTAPTKGATTTSVAATGKQDTTPLVVCQDGAFSGQAGPPSATPSPRCRPGPASPTPTVGWPATPSS